MQKKFGCSALYPYTNDKEPDSEDVKPLNPAPFFWYVFRTSPALDVYKIGGKGRRKRLQNAQLQKEFQR